jgi:hypothetical protein
MKKAKYYAAVRPQTNGYHAVHKEGCPFLPEIEKRIYLGELSSGRDAFKESRLHFKKTEGCIFCCSEIKIFNIEQVPFNSKKKNVFIKEVRIPVSLHQNLICGMN